MSENVKRHPMIPPGTLLAVTAVVVLIASLTALSGCGVGSLPTHEADYDVVIIGGGLGGLSAGAHLASRGLSVLVLEQHHKAGGCATNFTRGAFVFETSLHEMNGGGPIDTPGTYALLNGCGVYDKLADKLYRLPDFYRSVYPDGVDITLPADWEGWDAALKERWPDQTEGIDLFHATCEKTFADALGVLDIYRYSPLKAFLTKAMVPFKHKTLYRWNGRSVQELMDECFTNDDIKAVVSQLWVYYGPPTNDLAALELLTATYAYLTEGAWHIKGTSQAMSDAYVERIRDLGGEVRTGTLVTKIIIEEGVARGVQTEFGDTYTARYIVANTDPYQLVFKLIGQENLPKSYVKKIQGIRPANSLFGVYLGLNIDLKKLGYTDTEIFKNSARDSAVMYENMMSGNFKEGGASITIYTNYGDPIYAPPGKSVLVLHSYCDYDIWPNDRAEYEKMKQEKANELISLAATVIPQIGDPANIEVMEVVTPVTINEFTMNYHGIVYGPAATPDQFLMLAPSTPIDNVFMASNWNQHGMGPGHLNGFKAARMILDREGMD
ncbi:MAG: NAD(P)/FAD-dependent oxidoreductase [Deltaproteobacteria bacterium]|nr:NAD(P)/FAD-dependent oxidoreductase [Candidatus Zymogenaceae bacterium]